MKKIILSAITFLVLLFVSCKQEVIIDDWKTSPYDPSLENKSFDRVPEDGSYVLKAKMLFHSPGEDPKEFQYGVYYGTSGDIYAGSPSTTHLEFNGSEHFEYKPAYEGNPKIDTLIYNPKDSMVMIKLNGLAPKTDYHFYIYAKTMKGKRGYTKKSSFKTAGISGPPTVELFNPYIKEGSLTYASVSLTANVLLNGESSIKYAQVFYSTSRIALESIDSIDDLQDRTRFSRSDSMVNVINLLSGEVGLLPISVVNLQPNQTYYFRILLSNSYTTAPATYRNIFHSRYAKTRGITPVGEFTTKPYDANSAPIVTLVSATEYPEMIGGKFSYTYNFKVAKYASDINPSTVGIKFWKRGQRSSTLKTKYATDYNSSTGTFSVKVEALGSQDFDLASDYTLLPTVTFTTNGKENEEKESPRLRVRTAIFGQTDGEGNPIDANYYYELPGLPMAGGLLRFLDRNLGAQAAVPVNTPADPKELTQELTKDKYCGWLFQFGRPLDGHQYWKLSAKGESLLSSANVSVSAYQDALGMEENMGARFWKNGGSPYSWIKPAAVTYGNSLWKSDGIVNTGGIHNPCPAGYRVPTAAEFGVLNNAFAKKWENTVTFSLANGENFKFGLPRSIVYQRNGSGGGYSVNAGTQYSSLWSSDFTETSSMAYVFQWGAIVSEVGRIQVTSNYSGAGCFVRCVSTNIWPDTKDE